MLVGHYVENVGNTTLRFLEVFKTDRFEDISLNQARPSYHPSMCCEDIEWWGYAKWLALTPPQLVKAHLGLDDETIARLSKTKNTVVGSRAA